MKQLIKGTTGYLTARKRREAVKTLLVFILVAIVFATGYMMTKTRLNLASVIAALMCLPGCRFLVGLIVLLPYRSFPSGKSAEWIEDHPRLLMLFDYVFSSEKKLYHVDCLAVSKHTACGLCLDEKAGIKETTDYLKKYLAANKKKDWTVKLYANEEEFLSRIKAMEENAPADDAAELAAGKEIRHLLDQIAL